MYAFVCRFFLCITICVCLGADGAEAALVLQRRSSVDLSAGMASGGDEAMAAAAAVDGPKKMAKPGRRNSVEVIGPCLYAIPHLLCCFFYGAEAVFCTTHLCSDEARWICLQA